MSEKISPVISLYEHKIEKELAPLIKTAEVSQRLPEDLEAKMSSLIMEHKSNNIVQLSEVDASQSRHQARRKRN